MKNWMRLLAGVALFGWFSVVGFTHGNKPGTAKWETSNGTVTVDFVGPEAKGRDLMKLLPAGNYWRLGADKATTMSTSMDLMFGDKKLTAGDYTLVVHLNDAGEWAFVAADGLGAGFVPKTELGRASAELSELSAVAENMVIRIEPDGDKAKLMVDWGKSRLTTWLMPG